MLKDTAPGKGRHDRKLEAHQKARYHLRRGMATVALKAKVEGKPEVDCVGRPLLYANEMAERHGVNTLARWARGAKTVAIIGGIDFCSKCKRIEDFCKC